MNISIWTQAEALMQLYNRAQPQGMGFLHYNPKDMTVEEAEKIILMYKQKGIPLYFDYLAGRVMKINLTDLSHVDTDLYNRDNGPNAAEKACGV